MKIPYKEAAEAIKHASWAVALTGSGISAESGIPTFRGRGGIWTKYPPEEYATLDAYTRNPDKVWKLWRELAAQLGDSKPNAAHHVLAELEAMGLLQGVITQNVDNLHEDAGSKNVVEYHGNAHWLVCPRCRHRDPLDLTQHGEHPPYCFCGTLMKPDVVMFGEPIPTEALAAAEALTQKCDVLLVVGTTASVFPSALIPHNAKDNGAYIIEANLEETDLTHTITDAFLQGLATQTLPKLLELIKQ